MVYVFKHQPSKFSLFFPSKGDFWTHWNQKRYRREFNEFGFNNPTGELNFFTYFWDVKLLGLFVLRCSFCSFVSFIRQFFCLPPTFQIFVQQGRNLLVIFVVTMLISALVKRFSVSRMRDFYINFSLIIFEITKIIIWFQRKDHISNDSILFSWQCPTNAPVCYHLLFFNGKPTNLFSKKRLLATYCGFLFGNLFRATL